MEEPDLTSPGGRLRWARQRAKHASARAFADAIGINVVTYRAYEANQNGFAKLAPRLASKLGVPVGWLLEGGDGPGVVSSPPERSPDLPPTRLATEADDTVDIVALDLSLSMGPGTLIEEFVEEEPIKMGLRLVQSITRTPSNRLRLVRGIGDSMEPTLRTGDRVMVDINERALSRINGIYWIDHLGTHGIKRLRQAGRGKILVISDNPTIDNFEVDAEDLRIEGRVIWFGREL